MIPAHGYIVIRYRADNPGVWFFHCHIDLHLVGGMASTFIEAPDLIQKHHSIPDGGHSVCEGSGKGSKGNCAGGEGFISAEDAESECNTIWTAGGDGNVGVQLPANWREKRKQKRV
jgi:iron transport multicopper oxidase